MDAILWAKFDELVDRFNENDDEISIEDVNSETRKYFIDFLEAGFEVDQVTKMLSPEDIWEHYDTLTCYGANIDLAKLIPKFSRSFIRKNWDELAKRNVDIGLLIETCYNGSIENDNEVAFLLDKGVNAKTVFQLAETLFEFNEGWPERWAETFSILHEYGLPTEDIKKWLDSHIDDSLIYDIVEEHPEAWSELGINISDYAGV